MDNNELECGSNLPRPMSKLSYDLRSDLKRYIQPLRAPIQALLDTALWLENEL